MTEVKGLERGQENEWKRSTQDEISKIRPDGHRGQPSSLSSDLNHCMPRSSTDEGGGVVEASVKDLAEIPLRISPLASVTVWDSPFIDKSLVLCCHFPPFNRRSHLLSSTLLI